MTIKFCQMWWEPEELPQRWNGSHACSSRTTSTTTACKFKLSIKLCLGQYVTLKALVSSHFTVPAIGMVTSSTARCWTPWWKQPLHWPPEDLPEPTCHSSMSYLFGSLFLTLGNAKGLLTLWSLQTLHLIIWQKLKYNLQTKPPTESHIYYKTLSTYIPKAHFAVYQK